MADLIYSAIASLDGYVADTDGRFGWAVPDEDAVRQLKASAVRDIAIGGPDRAGQAIRDGLADQWQLYVTPVIIDGGTPSLPLDARVNLELIDERRFDNGMVYLQYRTATQRAGSAAPRS